MFFLMFSVETILLTCSVETISLICIVEIIYLTFIDETIANGRTDKQTDKQTHPLILSEFYFVQDSYENIYIYI